MPAFIQTFFLPDDQCESFNAFKWLFYKVVQRTFVIHDLQKNKTPAFSVVFFSFMFTIGAIEQNAGITVFTQADPASTGISVCWEDHFTIRQILLLRRLR